MVTLLLAGCGKDKDAGVDLEGPSDNFNETGMPIVDEPITIKFLTGRATTTMSDFNEVLIWQKYEDMTNVKIDWGLVQKDGLEEKRNLALAGNDYPEAFYTAHVPTRDILRYGQQGIFLELNDLIDDYMPNVKALFEEFPEIETALTFPDGNIYSLPTVYDPDFLSLTSNIKPWIKKEWLEDLGMDMPETTDDYYEFLKAVKETDLIGDGKGAEIPYGSTGIDGLLGWLEGAYNVGNKGRKHFHLDTDPETDELRFYKASDGYKEMLEYVHKLYKEGLIQENIFTIEANNYHEAGSKGLYATTVTTGPETRFGVDEGVYVGMPQLEGPHGDRNWSYVTDPIVHLGSFLITDKNKNPEATARWIDYFYGDEGATQLFMGIEDETYEKTEDGELEYLDFIKNDPDDLTLEQALKPYITWLGGGYPSIVKEKYWKGAESTPSSIEATEQIEPFIIDEIWPAFAYTLEEDKELAPLSSDIEKYVDEMKDKFIVGSEPFSEWDNYLAELDKMGLDRYMEIQQAAFERYEESKAELE